MSGGVGEDELDAGKDLTFVDGNFVIGVARRIGFVTHARSRGIIRNKVIGSWHKAKNLETAVRLYEDRLGQPSLKDLCV